MSYIVVIVGSGGAGKSCLVIRFTMNIFVEEYNPTIENTYSKIVYYDGGASRLTIVDTAGQDYDFSDGERNPYMSIADYYIKDADGFFIVYSITSRSSFLEIQRHYDRIYRIKNNERFPIILTGNKKDLSHLREISKKEGEELADTLNCMFFETSALTGNKINEAFTALVIDIRRHKFAKAGARSTTRPRSGSQGCVLL